jgi:hypothetical protein
MIKTKAPVTCTLHTESNPWVQSDGQSRHDARMLVTWFDAFLLDWDFDAHSPFEVLESRVDRTVLVPGLSGAVSTPADSAPEMHQVHKQSNSKFYRVK